MSSRLQKSPKRQDCGNAKANSGMPRLICGFRRPALPNLRNLIKKSITIGWREVRKETKLGTWPSQKRHPDSDCPRAHQMP
ncbi:hypothetical protein BC938DRAFT_481455 [Jimgerdemannia flammicorona]|uniref:Uncharacterized protein n=1 Tax=Jimgerdemannia flammicorona TaxID=994334 RepID=A0A433QG79_9FUNG|nr:hypothetical protein BC938DRAFT_481455 [Jimgerdemannia flammicorona]